jgi:TolB-like protein/Flp pilus assembly protein TadD
LTGDPAQEYFADGMTDALTTQLAQMGDFRVISRTSVMQYKGAKKLLSAIAQELNVDGVVEGAIVGSGPRVRITAQLIDARNDRHVWARSYERDLNDIVALQAEVAQSITEAVVGKLSPQQRERLISSRPISPEATELLFKGLVASSRESYQGFNDAINYFEQAIAKQPDFAAAYSRMSLCYIQFLFVGPLAPREFMLKAEAAARKALNLDEGLEEAHLVLGNILYKYHWNWSAAETEFRRARDLNPNSAEGHRMFAAFLARAGRSQEALAEAQRARELDPRSLQTLLNLAVASRAAGKYDQAVEELRESLQMDPQRPRAHFFLGITYVEKGDLNEGVAELEAAVKLSSGHPGFLAYLAYADAMSGKRREAQEILSRLESLSQQQYVSPVGIATIHIGLGEKGKGLTWLEKGYQAHDGELTGIATDHTWDALQSDPHFQDLLQRVGLAR